MTQIKPPPTIPGRFNKKSFISDNTLTETAKNLIEKMRHKDFLKAESERTGRNVVYSESRYVKSKSRQEGKEYARELAGVSLTKNQWINENGVNYYGLQERIDDYKHMDGGEKKNRQKHLLGREFLQAAARGNVLKLRAFLDERFSVNYISPESGASALHLAAASGARGAVLELLKTGKCDHLLKDRQNRFASEHAWVFGNDEAMSQLLGWKELKQLEVRDKQESPNTSKP